MQACKRLQTLPALPSPARTFACRLPPPEVLRPLTNLRTLAISTYDVSDEARAAIDAALRALPQLTTLYLRLSPPLPPAVTALARLRRFGWVLFRALQFDILPAGPWLASLRRLALVGAVPVDRLQALQAATQLEHLGLDRMLPAGAPDVPSEPASLLQFASHHPTLHQLQLSGYWGLSREELQATAAGLAAPHLAVSFVECIADLLSAAVPDLDEGFLRMYMWPSPL